MSAKFVDRSAVIGTAALTTEQAQQLRERATAGAKKSALAREFGISRETVYSHLRPAAATG
ncbi:Hin recombinase [Actinoplanes hulinensis]|uniref:Hin recombinase n=1 Tax=Actinoplanes hulinensis TaxID=1144547 RepID=A0ABS7B899_9ACTN|nr:Hin recombinase [Actinoplanes hulinensis]